jgi:glycerol transport system substrate-binding protein
MAWFIHRLRCDGFAGPEIKAGVKEIDGVAVYGHMDDGKKAPDLGWRFADAWLYAKVAVSKTASHKKGHIGLTIIRDSDINHESFSERAPKLGGLVASHRNPARAQGPPPAPTSPTVPSSPSFGGKTSNAPASKATADSSSTSPRTRAYWLDQPGSPKAKLDNEKPQGETVGCNELIKSLEGTRRLRA